MAVTGAGGGFTVGVVGTPLPAGGAVRGALDRAARIVGECVLSVGDAVLVEIAAWIFWIAEIVDVYDLMAASAERKRDDKSEA
jgi:hypothetical protein